MAVRASGPIPARIMIVGEAPGEDEVRYNKPFVGYSGKELDKMLGEAKIARSECFVTNVARERPPGNQIKLFMAQSQKQRKENPDKFVQVRDLWVTQEIADGFEQLKTEVEMVRPNIIIACGNLAMWALTGKWGILKWRGSMLQVAFPDDHNADSLMLISGTKVIPTVHPAAVLRQWNLRATVVSDLRRAARFRDGSSYPKPQWNFLIRPTYEQITSTLDTLLSRLRSGDRLRVSFDLETRSGHIACAGISWSLTDAICIPFLLSGSTKHFWSEAEETRITFLLYRVLTHPACGVVGQNILYDAQYTYRHWHFVPRVVQDTMISQHAIFSDLPKALAFQASMYCNYYVYWKDEGKNWDRATGEDELWYYNCEDCVYTDEVGRVEANVAKQMGLEEVHAFQQKMFWPVLQTMQRGVRVDLHRRSMLTEEVRAEVAKREQFIRDILGHTLNPKSPKQMHTLFYGDLAQKVVMTRATKDKPSRPTLNDEALNTIAKREPLLRPLVNAILDIRMMGVFLASFLTAPLDIDQRMRCAYNIGGSASGKSAPKTYRLSSSENAFGSGTNLQNIPSAKSKSLGKAAARGATAGLGDPYSYPNIRSMFIPDPGYCFFDGDLDRADLQVVVWEADDQMLKSALRMGADIHLMNAFVVSGKEPPPLEELVETHPKYPDHRGPYKYVREFAKVFCHGTNYGGGARTMAANTGRTVHEIDRAQRIWFGAHPGILRWHKRVDSQIKRHRFVENRFGYRWYIFDRLDAVLPEAIAWIPQSTVSIVINKIWMNLYESLPEVEVLLQCHDSIAGQIPLGRVQELVPKMKELARVVVPYEDPLTIPWGVKLSEKSWGDVK